MASIGVYTLADIARYLNTTPQAVSNWKARDQVPYRIISKLNFRSKDEKDKTPVFTSESTSLSDILLLLAEQLKLIITIPAILVFLSFTYIQFIQKPIYESSATVLFPENTNSNLGGLAGIASQFGVNIPSPAQADLSSPFLFPELLSSRRFAENIIYKTFDSDQDGVKTPLINILTNNPDANETRMPFQVAVAVSTLNEWISLEQDPYSSFSFIKIRSPEPKLSKELADVVLFELEQLNRFFKSQNVFEKTKFIDQRINTVEKDLAKSELKLKSFNEKNRQVSSPALQLELDRIEREVEIQKSIYLTLKQQLELAKIEEIQETSIVQILDKPQVPLSPANKNVKMGVGIAMIFGLSLGLFLSFLRSFINNNDIEERKKLRKVKNYVRKKIISFTKDIRITGIFALMMIVCFPFYLSHQSIYPKYFGMYSEKLMIFLLIYFCIMIFFIIAFIVSFFQKKNKLRSSL